jgi:hypothetical protein
VPKANNNNTLGENSPNLVTLFTTTTTTTTNSTKPHFVFGKRFEPEITMKLGDFGAGSAERSKRINCTTINFVISVNTAFIKFTAIFLRGSVIPFPVVFYTGK